VSISQPPDSVGFTQKCPGPACDLVSAWAQHVGEGVEWTEFGPIAENDFSFVSGKGTATIDVLANDKVFAPATWDVESIDLDPDTGGVQSTFSTDAGTFEVVDGKVTFTGADGPASTRCFYTVADSEGRVADARQISVAPRSS